MSNGFEFLAPKDFKYHSVKQKLDKNRFCKKNKVGPKRFGPHIYAEGNSRECRYCGHLRKNIRGTSAKTIVK